LSIQCDAPEKLARHLFDSGVLIGFDLDAEDNLLHIRVQGRAGFLRALDRIAFAEPVTVQAIRSQSRSLRNIFDKVTTT